MMSDEEMLGIAGGKYPAKKRKKHGELGDLYALMRKGLPDFVDDRGKLDVKALAESLGLSYQAVYKWFERDSINPSRVNQVIKLSESSKVSPADSVVLVRDDFWPFVGR